MSPGMRDPHYLPDVFWGSFLGNEVGFVCEQTYRHLEWPLAQRSFRTNVCSEFTDHPGFPDLKGAPLASWFFARVAFLVGDRFPYQFGEVLCTNPVNALVRFYCLTRLGNPMGLLSCTGEANKFSLNLLHGPDMDGLLVLRAFMEALLCEPGWVAKVRLIASSTEGLEKRHLPRVYGWDGEKYLSGTSFPLGDLKMKYHVRTYDLLRIIPLISKNSLEPVLDAEWRLGFEFPSAVREFYTSILSSLSTFWQNYELIGLEVLSVQKWQSLEIMPFTQDAHGVGVTLALLLDGSDDPPVYMHNENEPAEDPDDIQVSYWKKHKACFSDYVYSIAWEHVFISSWDRLFGRTETLSDSTIAYLRAHFTEDLRTFGEYRFIRGSIGIFIWHSVHGLWEWTIGTPDPGSLKDTVGILWALDGLGRSLESNSPACRELIELFRQQNRD